MDYSKPWTEFDLIALDLETTGASPIGNEICEIAAVRWRNGVVIDQYQTLIKPTRVMSDFIIGIHGITNEMVAEAPPIAAKIGEFHKFIQGAVTIAHHAPFDLGFLSYDMELLDLPLPTDVSLCTSLLARAVIPESPNHRLQTLVEFLGIPKRTAHRALSDAEACLDLALKCLERVGPGASMSDAFAKMGGALEWSRYSLKSSSHLASTKDIIQSIQQDRWLEVRYGKSMAVAPRKIKPQGFVRNPDGDFIFAFVPEEKKSKRFYLDRFQSTRVLEDEP